MADLVLPNRHQQILITGQNGSGKTAFGAFTLSKADFHRQPYVMIDFKGDDLLRSIQYVKQIGLNEIPKHPGVYRVQPKIDDEAEDERFFQWCRAVHARKRIGLYFDEGYMVPKGRIVNALYTQGRQLQIPIITLSQRPTFLTRFAVSEAYYHAVFFLSDDDDYKTVSRYVKGEIDRNPPKFCCTYYDVAQRATFYLNPCPPPEEIQQRIEDRLRPKRRAI